MLPDYISESVPNPQANRVPGTPIPRPAMRVFSSGLRST